MVCQVWARRKWPVLTCPFSHGFRSWPRLWREKAGRRARPKSEDPVPSPREAGRGLGGLGRGECRTQWGSGQESALWHSAGCPWPRRRSGRWHRVGIARTLEVVERILVQSSTQVAVANSLAAGRVEVAHAHVELPIVEIDLRRVRHGLALGGVYGTGRGLQGRAERVDLGQSCEREAGRVKWRISICNARPTWSRRRGRTAGLA